MSERSQAAVLAYDATVLAGTQGFRNHQKTDRLLGIALKHRLPVVLFAGGGGGRPGDTDMPIVAGLGGNAGTQTLTVIVRGIALGELNPANSRRARWTRLDQ